MFKHNSKILIAISLICFLLTTCASLAPPAQAAVEVPSLSDGQVINSGQVAFTDIPADSPLHPYIRYLTGKGIIEGYPDGTFRPSESVTRAKAAAVAVRLKGIPVVKAGPTVYSDVKSDHWANGEITAATKAGLFRGYPDGTFNPDSIITRAEAVTLLLRLSGGSLSEKNMAIRDVGPGHWAYRRVATAVEAGLAELSEDKLFKPDQPFLLSDLARSLSAVITLGPAMRETGLIGNLTVIKGKATLTTAGSVYHDITTETKVGAGATITTGEGGQAEIIFDDGSGILLESDTELIITKATGINCMRSDGSPFIAVDNLSVTLNKGFFVGAFAGRSDSAKITAHSLISAAQDNNDNGTVRGASWWNEPYAEHDRVFVEMPWGNSSIGRAIWVSRVTKKEQGTALSTGKATVTAGGTTVQLSGGQSATIKANGAPQSVPVAMSQADVMVFESARTWIDERANSIQNNLPAPPANIARAV